MRYLSTVPGPNARSLAELEQRQEIEMSQWLHSTKEQNALLSLRTEPAPRIPAQVNWRHVKFVLNTWGNKLLLLHVKFVIQWNVTSRLHVEVVWVERLHQNLWKRHKSKNTDGSSRGFVWRSTLPRGQERYRYMQHGYFLPLWFYFKWNAHASIFSCILESNNVFILLHKSFDTTLQHDQIMFNLIWMLEFVLCV